MVPLIHRSSTELKRPCRTKNEKQVCTTFSRGEQSIFWIVSVERCPRFDIAFAFSRYGVFVQGTQQGTTKQEIVARLWCTAGFVLGSGIGTAGTWKVVVFVADTVLIYILSSSRGSPFSSIMGFGCLPFNKSRGANRRSFSTSPLSL